MALGLDLSSLHDWSLCLTNVMKIGEPGFTWGWLGCIFYNQVDWGVQREAQLSHRKIKLHFLSTWVHGSKHSYPLYQQEIISRMSGWYFEILINGLFPTCLIKQPQPGSQRALLHVSTGCNLYFFNADEEKEVRVRLSKCLMEDIIIAWREIAFLPCKRMCLLSI